MPAFLFKSPAIMLKLGIFLLFLAISICFFGFGALTHFGSTFAANWHPDKFIYIWNLAWWPYALSHHLNPFFPAVVWPPEGINLAKYTSMPGLALIGAPFTYLWGPEITYNLMMLLSPALAAWTAFLLASRLLRSPKYAFVVGYFFGFSDYMISHMQAHLNLVSPVFLLPLFPLVILRVLDHEISLKRFTVYFTLLLTTLFLFSSEIFVTLTLSGSLIYLLAYIIFATQRKSLLNVIPAIITAYFLTTLICAPYLYYYFTDHIMGHVGAGVTAASNDFLNLFIPDKLFLLSNDATETISEMFTCNIMEWNTYLGVGLIVILILFAKEFWKTVIGKFFILSALILTIASLGPSLHVAGQKVLGFPWRILFMLPVIHSIAPSRLALFASLPIALMVGYWLQHSALSKTTRTILLGIAVLFLLPSFNQAHRQTYAYIKLPVLFQNEAYKNIIKPNDVLMMLPFFDKGDQVYWQAHTQFDFTM
jgi:hypothetical protein